ncbi:MAG: 16S rRNA (adenine(1518)-N(6)/adenine(1519)-N(6))-dimethyltransferase RsmA [Patescibacteria group bacterium]
MLKKKSLGQHFLHSPHYVSLIADTAEITKGEWVLEVGPGEGVLTRELLSHGAKVVAIEKDHRLIPVLEKTFAEEIKAKQLFVYEGDALELSLKDVGIKGTYKVVANIPYYITGLLIKKFLSEKKPATSLVLLVQKEVAERIAREKKESILSLSVKVYGEPKYVKTVPRGAFVPPPNVDSAILAVKNISRTNLKDAAAEAKFFTLVKTGFAQKRKLLKRNLEKLLGTNTSELFKKAGIAENARAEDIELSQWLKLASLK